MKTERQFFRFHTGRGGRFYNAGYVTFEGIVTEREVMDFIESNNELFFRERDEQGRFYNAWTDAQGNEKITLKEMRDGIAKGALNVDFDTDYDSEFFLTVDNLSDKDISVIERCKYEYYREEALAIVKAYRGEDY